MATPSNSPAADANLSFGHYQTTGDPTALAATFEATAPGLLQLARQLCRGDVATAEDLVQTTFLAAIEHRQRYRQGESVQAWLGGILTNQARDVARKQRRSLDPDRLPERLAPPAADESTSPRSAAEHNELDAAIDHALDDMPATYGEVLRPYLRRGLAAQQIAEALGRPAGTVRTQIVRGLDRLRGALPVGLAGAFAAYVTPGRGLAAVRTAVLEHSRQHVAIGTAATGAATLTSLLLMKKSLFSVAATAALAASAWVAWSPSPPKSPVDSATERSADQATASPIEKQPLPSSQRIPRDQSSTRANAATPSKPKARGTKLSGIAVDRDGQPLAGVRVLAFHRRDYPLRTENGFDRKPGAITRTDTDGRFTIHTAGSAFELTADTDTLYAQTRVHGTIMGRGQIDGLELVLAPTIELEGILLDADGAPIADHLVGTHLGMSRSIADRTDHAGVIRRRPDHLRTRTDAEGRFRLRCIAEHKYLFEVLHPEHPMWRQRHVPADGPLTIRLERGAALTGRVRRANGRPAVGAEVRLADSPVRTALCDATGAFTIRGATLEEHSYLTIRDPESAFHAVQPVPKNQEIQIQLEAAQTIRGIVVDQDNRPLEGILVTAVGDRVVDPGYVGMGKPTVEWACGIEQPRTEADGSFIFDNLYDGIFEIRAHLNEDEERFVAQTVRSTVDNIQIRLTPALTRKVTLQGTVQAAAADAGGEAIAGFELMVHKREDEATIGRRYPAPRAGTFEVSGLESGNYSVEVRADGYAVARTPFRKLDYGNHRVEILLHKVASARFLVVDSDAQPVVANMSFLDRDGSRLWVPTPFGTSNGVHTAKDGTVRVDGLPRTGMRVVVSRHPLPDAVFDIDLTTPPAEPIRLVVPLSPKDISISLNVIEVAADVDRETLPTIFKPSDRPRLRQLMQDGKLSFPAADVLVELVDANGRQLASGKAIYSAPEADGRPPEYAIKTNWNRARTGYGSSGSRQAPVFELRGFPGQLVAKIQINGRPAFAVPLDLTNAGDGPIEALAFVTRPPKSDK